MKIVKERLAHPAYGVVAVKFGEIVVWNDGFSGRELYSTKPTKDIHVYYIHKDQTRLYNDIMYGYFVI